MKYVDLAQSKITLKQAIEKYNPGTVLALFNEGLGDALNFIDIYDQVKEKYKNIKFSLAFDSSCRYYNTIEGSFSLPTDEADKFDLFFKYDLVVKFSYPNKENSTQNKQQVCIEQEIGFPVTPKLRHIKPEKTKIVGIGAWSTTSPQLRLMQEEYNLVRRDIIDAGYIPLEIHFSNRMDNHSLRTTETTRAAVCTLENLFGSLLACDFFLGVNSGPLFAAMRILPLDRVACLDRMSPPLEWHTDVKIKKFPLQSLQRGDVSKWIKAVNDHK